MAECFKVTANLTPTCTTTKEKGGIDATVRIGSVHDITGITYGTGNEITAITLASNTQMWKFKGRKYKHNAGHDLETGENVVLRNHVNELVLYAKKAAEKKAYDELVDSEDMFTIIETNSGQFEVYGLPKDGEDWTNYGMNPTAGSGRKGVNLNDPNNKPLTLSGMLPNIEMVFNEAGDFDTNLATIEALCSPQA